LSPNKLKNIVDKRRETQMSKRMIGERTMKRNTVLIVMVLAYLFVGTSAFAALIDPFNIRPATVGTASGSEASLQTIINSIYGGSSVNANTDQQTAGMWGLISQGAVTPLLRFEYASNANIAGIWSGENTSEIFTRAIFKADATGSNNGFNTSGTITWFTPTSGEIYGDSSKIFTGSFSNIPYYNFGFYLQGPDTGSGTDGKFWSVDQLNPQGSAQMLAYRHTTSNTWIMAFEDQNLNSSSTDGDHNDFVFSVESIVPVPEPGTMILLGSGLVGLAGWGRKKFRK
jgi:hypothetical protein